MCGRAYETYTEEELSLRYFNEKRKHAALKEFKPNYNLCPTQLSPVILIKDGKLAVERFRWGLIPFWAKDVKSAAKYSLINCVGEEIDQKRSYKGAFERRRCIVPVSGFYEWKRAASGSKRPFVIRNKDQSILSLAGVWEHWESKESDEVVDSFSIITTEANATVKKVHHRMPVILEASDEAQWLDPESRDPVKLKKFLKPCPASLLEIYEISPAVNSPKNNRKEVLEPLIKPT